MPEPVVAFVLTPHATFELQRRGLDETIVRQVLAAPEQREALRPGRAEVITVYRTSKIDKYWRSES